MFTDSFSIALFHPRGQQPRQFVGAKEAVYVSKKSQSHTIGVVLTWLPFHGFQKTIMAAMTSCENAQ